MTARPTLSTVEDRSLRWTVPNFGEVPKIVFRRPLTFFSWSLGWTGSPRPVTARNAW
jgi:hypothetical protein